MIGRLTGQAIEIGHDGCCVIDVSGVGYEVVVPQRCLPRLPLPPASATLHVHTHVREDALLLYGFENARDRLAFRMVQSVSGVGPKLAMALLSELSADDLRRVVATDDKRRLSAVSGVGKKTAERLVLELRDRVDALGIGAVGAPLPMPSASAPIAAPTTRAGEAVLALVSLGFGRGEAEIAVAKVAQPDEDRALEIIVRQALGTLA